MSRAVDMIVEGLPPPGKLRGGGGDTEAEADDYDPEEAAAMAVAKALGIAEDKVDVPALCSALRDFNATSSTPTPEE